MRTHWKRLTITACAAALLAACVMGSPDGINDVGVGAGKVDGSDFTDCELDAVLDLVVHRSRATALPTPNETKRRAS